MATTPGWKSCWPTWGATRPELIETIGVGVLMGGGPGSIYAVHALDAVDQLLPPEPA